MRTRSKAPRRAASEAAWRAIDPRLWTSAILDSARSATISRPARFRNLRERSEIGQRIDRLEAVGFADTLERLQSDVPQHHHRLAPHRFVTVVARNRPERTRIHELRHRRLAHARVFVFARNGRDDIAFREGISPT